MGHVVMQLATALTGSLGFCLIFRLRGRLLLPASVGGAFCWAVYLLGSRHFGGTFLPSLIASAFAAVYAELLARFLKAPATLFFISAAIPMVPGSTLYYAMSYAVQGEWEISSQYGTLTVQCALGIAIGISLVWAVCDMLGKLFEMRRRGKRGR